MEYLRSYYIKVFSEYSSYIERYILLKEQYEKYLFSEQYREALHIIDSIEEQLGLSVWSISKKMLLFDKIEGLEKHKRYLSELQSKADNNIILSTLFELESYFAESNTSYSAYKKRLESYNDILQENYIIRQYLDFKFNVEREYEHEEVKVAFMFDSQLSIVDMYETFVLAEQLIEEPGKIGTQRNENYDLLELYTCGEYQQYIEKCEQYLVAAPQDFQCIILLVKSYIFLQKEMKCTNSLYKWIYDVYSLNGNEIEAIQELFAYLKVVRFTSWEYKIIGLLEKQRCPNAGR